MDIEKYEKLSQEEKDNISASMKLRLGFKYLEKQKEMEEENNE